MRVTRPVMLAAIFLLPRSAGAWSTDIGSDVPTRMPAPEVARLPDGNVVVTAGGAFRLPALSAASGAVQWSYYRGYGAAVAVSVDGAGNVVAAGWTATGLGYSPRLTALKIHGTTGQEQWRYDLPHGPANDGYANDVDADETTVAV